MMMMANEQGGNLSLKFTAERNRLIINEQKGKIRAFLIVAIVKINPIWDEMMGFFRDADACEWLRQCLCVRVRSTAGESAAAYER